MDLKYFRNEIDGIDEEILSLFIKRMGVVKGVAKYKKENNLPVLQGNREDEVIARIRELSPNELADGSAVLFTNIMDISKSLQQQEISAEFPLIPEEFDAEKAMKIGCQGVSGSYQEEACRKLFGDKPITFLYGFEDVFKAVENGDVDYGVLPIQNSTSGSVSETYDLMKKYNFYITTRIQVEITHCLAVKKGVTFEEVKKVYSKEEALAQCSKFLYDNGLEKISYINTAAAAQLVKSSSEAIGAICSESCAELYGLEILRKGIANVSPNYTRFICISKKFKVPESPQIISVSLAIPNTKGSLYRLLTKFSVNDLDLEHIESKPIADGSFDAIFYLDFAGDIKEKKVSSLLNELTNELAYFKFIGNYEEIL